MITYSTREAGTPAFSRAPLMAIAPRSLPEKSLSEPISLPMESVLQQRSQTSSSLPPGAFRAASLRLSTNPTVLDPMSLGYLCVMTAEQVDARPVLASALVTAVDHVGIAVPDLDAAIQWYHEHLGMILVHEEINEDQGIREAMLSLRGASPDCAQIQLMASLDENSTIAKFIDKRGPGIQQMAYRVSDLDALSDQLRSQGVRLVYDAPRRGTANSRINFIHPKDAGGVLVELVEPASSH